MDLRKFLSVKHSKENVIEILEYIGNDKNKFADLMHLFFTSEYRIQQRSAYYVSHCYDKHPDLIKPYLVKMIQTLEQPDLIVALKRNILRILQTAEIPKTEMGKLTDLAFEFLLNPKEPIAVRVFAMSTIENICKTQPEIKEELKNSIELVLETETVSSGTLNRANKILARICK